MSFEKEASDLQDSLHKLAYHDEQFDKQASLIGMGLGALIGGHSLASKAAISIGGTMGGDALLQGLSAAAKKNSANYLHAGIELGRSGKEMNPFKERMSRNVFGQRQIAPYEEGLQVGRQMKDMDPAAADAYLHEYINNGVKEYDALKAQQPQGNFLQRRMAGVQGIFNKDKRAPKIPAHLEAINAFNQGEHLGGGSLIKGGVDPNDTRFLTKAQGTLANAATLPLASLDARFAARPVVRAIESGASKIPQPIKDVTGKLVETAAPDGTIRRKGIDATKKLVNVARDYIN
jgi:hypothetical protein